MIQFNESLMSYSYGPRAPDYQFYDWDEWRWIASMLQDCIDEDLECERYCEQARKVLEVK